MANAEEPSADLGQRASAATPVDAPEPVKSWLDRVRPWHLLGIPLVVGLVGSLFSLIGKNPDWVVFPSSTFGNVGEWFGAAAAISAVLAVLVELHQNADASRTQGEALSTQIANTQAQTKLVSEQLRILGEQQRASVADRAAERRRLINAAIEALPRDSGSYHSCAPQAARALRNAAGDEPVLYAAAEIIEADNGRPSSRPWCQYMQSSEAFYADIRGVLSSLANSLPTDEYRQQVDRLTVFATQWAEVRARHSALESSPSSAFRRLAEKHGLTAELSAFTTAQALQDAADYERADHHRSMQECIAGVMDLPGTVRIAEWVG